MECRFRIRPIGDGVRQCRRFMLDELFVNQVAHFSRQDGEERRRSFGFGVKSGNVFGSIGFRILVATEASP